MRQINLIELYELLRYASVNNILQYAEAAEVLKKDIIPMFENTQLLTVYLDILDEDQTWTEKSKEILKGFMVCHEVNHISIMRR